MTNKRSPITSHILDVSRGRPAARVAVLLESQNADGSWKKLECGETNDDGRVEGWLDPEKELPAGTYRLTFETEAYFKKLGVESFYPHVSLVFRLKNPKEHYHVPLLLSPFGYSTYRGT